MIKHYKLQLHYKYNYNYKLFTSYLSVFGHFSRSVILGKRVFRRNNYIFRVTF